MKSIIRAALIILAAAYVYGMPFSFSQDIENISINELIKNIEKFRKKKITLTLKLKGIDNIFEKIVFYDKKKSEIEFDISSKDAKGRISQDMLNIHEGMDFNVTFIVNGVGNLGWIIADLISFKPVVLDKLP